MSCYHIFLEQGRKKARSVKNAEEFKALRSTPEQMENLRRARDGDAEAKTRLVQFNYSGHYPDGVLKGNKLPSGTFGFDIDDKSTFEVVSSTLLSAPEEYGLLLLERSVSQGGHAVFKREQGKTILENQVRVSCLLECEIDTNAHDINRVYFGTSAEPDDLLYLSDDLFADDYFEEYVTAEAALLLDRERNGKEELPPGAHKANKHYKPWEIGTAENAETLRTETSAPADNGGGNNVDSDNVAPDSAAVLQRNVSDVSAVNKSSTAVNDEVPNYQGIPYQSIIDKYWELYNDGRTPVKSNRNTLTYELAMALRHICGFDRVLMAKVIPCYDDFPLQEKMSCIDSAISAMRTQMPPKLREVLFALRRDNIGNTVFQDAIDEIQLDDELTYFKRFPKGSLPQGVIDSVRAAGDAKVMPVITAITPMIGMLATNVQVEIHGIPTGINLISYICGKAGSGKGSIDPIVDEWMHFVRAQDDLYLQQEQEYRSKKNAAKNSKNQPEEPKLPVRFLPLNNTLPNIAERLANTDGIHSFSFTPEADTITARWKSSLCDYSVMLRQAYDGTRYDREARSAEAVNVHISRLLWNVTMCGTQDALYRLITNYTDGLLSRMSIARLPDNTFTPLSDKPVKMLPEYSVRIRQIAQLLPLMQGTLVLPKLEQKSREWVEKIRMEAMKNNDTVLADARLRDHINAYRMTVAIILCMVAERLIKAHGFYGAEQKLKASATLAQDMATRCQTPAMLEAYEIIADSLIDNDMYFFRDRIEKAYKQNAIANSARVHRGKNDTIYDRVSDYFSFEDLMKISVQLRGVECTPNSVHMMLKNWCKQGLIERVGNMKYQKVRA